MSNPPPVRRRTSLPSQSSKSVVASIDSPASRTAVFIKHGKYVLVGGLGCWYLDYPDVVKRTLEARHGWIRRVLITGLGLHIATIFIFLYLVLFLPWVRGFTPNYPKWQESARLRIIVPLLTASIIGGWTCLVISLSQAGKTTTLQSVLDAFKAVGNASLEQMEGREGMGIFSSMAGATALFTLTLGILGMIPAPSSAMKKRE
ncbi:hypothetical protein L198_03572 [Cryptococcus wingfieldii CBS 7118]|uniref:Uncharacterized protein n=1 Tax=Cryptococcus wingfieldii CBS 7118 TaxID=1295528 RepID=A0A1E3JBS1_9TREE|nr:hypothetical protein L198_03572 [Cryptococcus wingfieldii CBS 7118]ODN98328.1 hypothetical protein L198_03572 [Cryptococcus wingfieldii CBS 7118]